VLAWAWKLWEREKEGQREKDLEKFKSLKIWEKYLEFGGFARAL